MTRSTRAPLLLLGALQLLAWQCEAADPDAYWNQRAALLEAERARFLGSKLKLTDAEQRANTVLMAAKQSEFNNCFDPLCFPPARHFFSAKQDIDVSMVFDIIKRMPKGTFRYKGIVNANILMCVHFTRFLETSIGILMKGACIGGFN